MNDCANVYLSSRHSYLIQNLDSLKTDLEALGAFWQEGMMLTWGGRRLSTGMLHQACKVLLVSSKYQASKSGLFLACIAIDHSGHRVQTYQC